MCFISSLFATTPVINDDDFALNSFGFEIRSCWLRLSKDWSMWAGTPPLVFTLNRAPPASGEASVESSPALPSCPNGHVISHFSEEIDSALNEVHL
jgi:hypothetical protein